MTLTTADSTGTLTPPALASIAPSVRVGRSIGNTPWLPAVQFRKHGQAGMYGNFVAHVDHVVGQILQAVEDAGQVKLTAFLAAEDGGMADHVAQQVDRPFASAADGLADVVCCGMHETSW